MANTVLLGQSITASQKLLLSKNWIFKNKKDTSFIKEMQKTEDSFFLFPFFFCLAIEMGCCFILLLYKNYKKLRRCIADGINERAREFLVLSFQKQRERERELDFSKNKERHTCHCKSFTTVKFCDKTSRILFLYRKLLFFLLFQKMCSLSGTLSEEQ